MALGARPIGGRSLGDSAGEAIPRQAPPAPPSGGMVKVWSGSAWVEKPVKVWSGSAWVTKPVKVWNGSAWVLA